jgi:cell shape-determining protein MreC
MSDQAIIALVCAVAAGIGSLVYFLMGNIKSALEDATDDMIRKIEKFVDELAKVKENVAVKSTMLDYMQTEIEGIKRHCYQCEQRNSNNNKKDYKHES